MITESSYWNNFTKKTLMPKTEPIMQDDLSHYYAIEARLNREKIRLFHATNENERVFREHEVKMAQKELDGEVKFLAKRGISIPSSLDDIMMSDDELLAELTA